MTDGELAVKYAPHLYFDKNETSPIAYIGYKVIGSSGRSPSFNRDIPIDASMAALCARVSRRIQGST